MTRTSRSISNIIWAIIYKMIAIIMPFLVRTVIIYKLGLAYAGLNGLFSSVLTVLSLSELGFSNAIVYSMYQPIHDNDIPQLCALLNLYKKVYRIIGLVVAGVGLSLIPALNYLIKGAYPQDINLVLLYLVFLINTVMSYFMFSYKSALLTAYQRYDIVSKIGLLWNFVFYLLQITTLFFFKNYYIYTLTLPVLTIIINIRYELASRKEYPEIHCEGSLAKAKLAEIKKSVSGALLYKVSSISRTSFDSIIISVFLGLTVLAQYQNYFLIISSLSGVLGVINTSITASVGNSIVSKSQNENYHDFKSILTLYMCISIVFTTCLVGLYQPFMKIWVGIENTLSTGMAVLFCLYFFVQTMGDIVYVYRMAAGLWWGDRIRPIVESIANVALNIILVKYFGLYGVISATILTLFFINFFWGSEILFKYYFKMSIREYVLLQGKNILVCAVAVGITFALCSLIPDAGFWWLIPRALISVLIAVIAIICFNSTSPVFQDSLFLMQNIVRVFRKV
ncbi:hypothetical protein SDC9_63983 [bioreactor metagenome]|uniref:Uncharacterized protein n=1 Tax=bioreactor metagenome TaxID=1076179 RepID=A0A644XN21_9ZZZZ|nr:polysaccharide biosynthesis C-terminal domain-containing protein [Candidatus Metalachnospira sp.]